MVREGDEPGTECLGARDLAHAQSLRAESWRSQAVACRVAAGGGVPGPEHRRVGERENEQDEAEGCGHKGDALGSTGSTRGCRDSLAKRTEAGRAG